MSVLWTGLDEFLTELRNLPSDLATEASSIVIGAATAAFNEIHDKYPERTGHLRAGLKLQVRALGPYGTGMQVVSAARHAMLYETGTAARYYTGTDALGRTSNHAARGAVLDPGPPGRAFVPISMRRRREMYRALKDLLVRHGARVTGDPG